MIQSVALRIQSLEAGQKLHSTGESSSSDQAKQHDRQISSLERCVQDLTTRLTEESSKSAKLAQQLVVSEWHLQEALQRVNLMEQSVLGRLEVAEGQLEKVSARAKTAVAGATEALKFARTMEGPFAEMQARVADAERSRAGR